MDVPAIVAVDGIVRHYAWGSPRAIPDLLGVAPDGRPWAELWFGAHPDDPSSVPTHETTLDKLVADDPVAALGADVATAFDGRLPFLLKVLAAGTALSIQVHPTLAQAREGYAAENTAGVPRDAAVRNYRDANHKPELICALTEFDALCGFRPVARTLDLFAAVVDAGAEAITPYCDLLAGDGGLRACFTALLELPAQRQQALVAEVLPALRRIAEADGTWAAEARSSLVAASDFPGDIGAVIALQLNTVRLQPGEAIFLAAGNVHAYLRGVGVEIMANSDNVLRCGLTPKHVDVAELLRVTDFDELDEPRWAPRDGAAGERIFTVTVPDFALTRVDLDAAEGPVTLTGGPARIVLCTAGAATVEVGGDRVELAPGHAAFAAASPESAVVSGSGTVFAASVGTVVR